MKNIIYIFAFTISLCIITPAQSTSVDKQLINSISDQLLKEVSIIGFKYPEYTENGVWKFRKDVNWLSGFLSGELWYMYDITGREEFKKDALAQADHLTAYSTIDNTHDMGFIFLPSCAKAYKETGDKKYLKAALDAAGMLAKRFNGKGNFIRAWGSLKDSKQAGWMIIDSMMNIELLFWAYQQTGNLMYYDIAYKHAITTMEEIVRSNYSSYHVVEFDPATGKILAKRTSQGFSDESTWARGQAWGIFGFANAYKYTGDKRFLNTSQKMADYFLSNLPSDLVPVWDLDLNGKSDLRDASAGAVAASGMFILSEVSRTKKNSQKYLSYAKKITSSLIRDYLFTTSKRKTEEGILLHTIYHFHKKWGVDESFPPGDYYFIEALAKLWKYQHGKNIFKDEAVRQNYRINEDWFYLQDNLKEPGELAKTTAAWMKINLPNTWNNFDATDNEPGYRREASWYEKLFYIPDYKNELKLFLHFEGVNITSQVFVNGKLASSHVGGYIGFDVDITSFIIKGKENQILVRVDNSVNPEIIPSQKSDFFIYGGINRDVWLKVLPANYIINAKISSPQVSEKKAGTSTQVYFNLKDAGKYEIKVQIKNEEGETVSSSSKKIEGKSGGNNLSIDLPSFDNPHLWSPADPYLYSISIQLNKDGKTVDTFDQKFGYRFFEFKPHGAFYLNGMRLLLRGTHWHEDYAGLGNALPDSLKVKDFKMIKSMGANYIRLAHYPQDTTVYNLCDELGILVWDELPWCRGGVGDSVWKENTKRMLTEIINQNYNHPGIIIRSLGNEIPWIPDFPNGDNVDSINTFLKELNHISHTEDPYRLTAVRKYSEAANIVDVFSPSIWAGWYSGVYKNYQKAIEEVQKEYTRMVHMEYGGDCLLGRHTENPISGEGVLSTDEWTESANQVKVQNIASMGDWSENYIVDLFDWYLRYSESTTTFAGNAQWAFKDFGTPLRPENAIPYINMKGLVDRAGNPKDAFYVFKSYWNSKDKFCYIESHTWTERSGPQNLPREVRVYSNCSEVELYLNGKSLGKKEKDIKKFLASDLDWKLNFTEGSNFLKAIGYENGKQIVVDTLTVHYTYKKAGTPEKINLTSTRLSNGDYMITAVVVDKDGLRCLDYSKRLYFAVSGPGKLLENYGTVTGSSVIEAANGMARIEFKPLGYDRAVIEVRNQDFKGDYITIN